MKLSVLVPVYNEEATLSRILRQVLELPLELEVLILDDGSTDRTWEILKTLEAPTVRIFRHKSNRGKGAALRTLIPEARGDFVVIQDGDLEYDPADLVRMLREAEEHQAPVIYGNRAHGRFRRSYWRYYWGGKLLTMVTNLLYGTRIHDEPVCYKMFRRELLQSLPLECEGFEFCPEVTARVILGGHPIREIPISYSPRSFSEGKKIHWRDGILAVWVLLRLRIRGRGGKRP